MALPIFSLISIILKISLIGACANDGDIELIDLSILPFVKNVWLQVSSASADPSSIGGYTPSLSYLLTSNNRRSLAVIIYINQREISSKSEAFHLKLL